MQLRSSASEFFTGPLVKPWNMLAETCPSRNIVSQCCRSLEQLGIHLDCFLRKLPLDSQPSVYDKAERQSACATLDVCPTFEAMTHTGFFSTHQAQLLPCIDSIQRDSFDTSTMEEDPKRFKTIGVGLFVGKYCQRVPVTHVLGPCCCR